MAAENPFSERPFFLRAEVTSDGEIVLAPRVQVMDRRGEIKTVGIRKAREIAGIKEPPKVKPH